MVITYYNYYKVPVFSTMQSVAHSFADRYYYIYINLTSTLAKGLSIHPGKLNLLDFESKKI